VGTHPFPRAFLDLLFPRRCLGCGSLGSYFCPTCQRAVESLPGPFCARCKTPIDPLLPLCHCHGSAIPVIAAGVFAGPLREAVHRLKYSGQTAGAPALAELLRPRLTLGVGDWLLVPVALHPARLRERGYNQSAVLARALASDRPEHLAEGALRRVRRTDAQARLSQSERARNVDGAFRADSRICAGREILLIDDVCTTGATLRAAAEALRDAGATTVSAAVLAVAVT